MLGRVQNIVRPLTPSLPKRWTGLRYMVDYWQMNEVSAGVTPVTRADWIGSNPFTDPVSVPSAPGIIGNGANFVASASKGLLIPNNTELQMGASPFGCTCWMNFATVLANMALIVKGNNTNAIINMEWSVSLQATPRFIFRVTDGVTVGSVTSLPNAALATGVWHFLAFWWDGAFLNIQLNNGTVAQAAWTNAILATTTPLRAGSSNQAGRFLNAVLDEVGLYKGGFLDSTERTFLYNAGAGKAPPFAA